METRTRCNVRRKVRQDVHGWAGRLQGQEEIRKKLFVGVGTKHGGRETDVRSEGGGR